MYVLCPSLEFIRFDKIQVCFHFSLISNHLKRSAAAVPASAGAVCYDWLLLLLLDVAIDVVYNTQTFHFMWMCVLLICGIMISNNFLNKSLQNSLTIKLRQCFNNETVNYTIFNSLITIEAFLSQNVFRDILSSCLSSFNGFNQRNQKSSIEYKTYLDQKQR
ncbi:hypothetical protein FF38_03196 [Lucilia cuprina]|uniref:Uncharacterized protein n=1 Tax=Lucilia cuprina TaxID=7375 RepID=A0A0L0BP25_LUCCU|nr:hypothetical protein FF38_03196 [Lucilia cuprina]